MTEHTCAIIIQRAWRTYLTRSEKCDHSPRTGMWTWGPSCGKRFIPDPRIDYGEINMHHIPTEYHCNKCLCICMKPDVDYYPTDTCNMCYASCCSKCSRGCVCCDDCGRPCQYGH